MALLRLFVAGHDNKAIMESTSWAREPAPDTEQCPVHAIRSNHTIKPHPVLDEARAVLGDHGIAHATLQVEPESHEGCAELTW
jgi:hypothetical protein